MPWTAPCLVNLLERQRLAHARRRERRVPRVGDRVAWHVALEQSNDLVATDLADAGKLQLEEKRRRTHLRRRLDALEQDPENPAARVVLKAAQAIHQPLVQQRVIVAPYRVPSGAHRPLAGNVHLLEGLAVVAVARAHHLGGLRRIAGRHRELLLSPVAADGFGGGIESPPAGATPPPPGEQKPPSG